MKSKIYCSKLINSNRILNKFNFKKIGKIVNPIGLSIIIGLFYKNKNFLKSQISYCETSDVKQDKSETSIKNILESSKIFDKKIFILNSNTDNKDDSEIFIIYNQEIPLQIELKDILKEKIKNYLASKNIDEIKVNIIDLSKNSIIKEIKDSNLHNFVIDCDNSENLINLKKKENSDVNFNPINNNYILEKLNSLNESNEPLVLIKSGYCIESFNALSFIKDERITKNNNKYCNKNISFSLQQKMDNIILYNYCDEMIELREHFKFLDKPENKIMLIPAESFKNKGINLEFENLDYKKLKYLSLFKDKNTKIIFVNNSELSKNLKLDNDLIYIYYPPKMPNVMKNVENFLQDNKLTQRYEGVDLNKLFNNSPVNFILKFHFFRDEIKLNIENLKSNFNSYDIKEGKSSNFLFNKFERIKLQKLFSYPKRNVRQLANTNKNLFKKTWNEKNKSILYIWLPNWAFLKENLFNFILYEANHLFDEIQITTSKNFTQKNKLFDNSGLADDLPQLFIIQTGNLENNSEKKIYAFNYFRFSNELENYMSNRHPIFKLQTPVENYTNVQFINSKNFKEKILDDKKLKEFVLEIKHEGCPSCFMLGKMFDHLSLKIKKHKLENKIKLFRIDTENDLRYLGDFAATPTYVFGKKNDKGEITFLNEIPKQEFIFRLKKYSNYDLTKIRYHPNLYFGFQVYQNKMFLKPEYDPDIDINSYV